MNKFARIWKEAFGSKKFLVEFFVSFLILIITMICFSQFVQFVELRNGVQLSDPLLNSYSAINLTWPIFIMIYGAIIFALLILIYFPTELVILFEAYALMVIIRMIFMFAMPLDPPIGMIPLQDPFVQFFGSNKSLTKDLFFSGHTASLFLLSLSVPKKWKWFFFSLTIAVAIAVILQKIHYVVDVLVAPFISFCCYFLASRRHKILVNE